VLEVDYIVVDVLEVDVLGVSRFFYIVVFEFPFILAFERTGANFFDGIIFY